MVSITAILHTENDALRLGRALETLYACDGILVVDHGSRDATARIAREYGARVVDARPGLSPGDYLRGYLSNDFRKMTSPQWMLCLEARESLTEKLAATLFEWKSEAFHAGRPGVPAFSVFLREETAQGWTEHPAPQVRLVPQTWNLWDGALPVHQDSAVTLEGELLRFDFP